MARISVLIFAKYPEPGSVKTRLVPPLSPKEAAALHKASLLAVCQNVASVSGLEPIWVVTPDERVGDARGVAGDIVSDYWPQGEGDLGRRLDRAAHRAFDAGAGCVVLLGADSPTLPAHLLEDAVDRLAEHDAVLGPCDDGGYYLLGLRRALPALFVGIDWGGDLVAEQTRRRAADARIALHELPAWYDLDRFGDLQRAARDLADSGASRELSPPGSRRGQERTARDDLRRLINDHLIRYGDGGTHEA